MHLSHSPIGGSYLLVALFATVLLVLMFLGPVSSRLPLPRRRVLVGVRLAVIVLVLLIMLRPTLVRPTITKQSATLILLVDRSRSMLVADIVGNTTRWNALQAAMQEALPALTELQEDLQIKIYTFASEPQAIEFKDGQLNLGAEPDGQQTALGHVLDSVLKQEAGQRVAGVILLSDGAQRAYSPRDLPPQVPARQMADMGNKLYAVGFGQSQGRGETQDIAMQDLLVAQQVFVKNQLDVSGMAVMNGFANQSVPMQLLFEKVPGQMSVVDSETVTSTQTTQRMPVELAHIPQTPGEYKLTLKALTPKGKSELVTTNNDLSTFVTVLKGGLNVLYIQGELRPEQGFLRRSLDASPDMKVDYLRIDPRKKATRPGDLMERFQPGSYDVYILGDIDSTAFEAEELEALASAVDAGAGLIMLGGLYSHGPGGYGETPLAKVLPIEIGRLERQRLGEAIREDLHIAGKIPMLPTEVGEKQNLMLLGPREKNAELWSALPPLNGANRFTGVKRGAGILAESPNGDPLLVAKDYGVGRAMAFAGDSTWSWHMHGFEKEHRRFWRQIVLWLARKDQSTEGKIWIKLEQRRFSPNSRVEFTVGAETAEGEPITDASFKAEIVQPDGSRVPARMRKQGDAMLGTFTDGQAAGDYTVEVTATRAMDSLGNARARFLVFEQDLELDNPAADRSALESLVAMTEGRVVAPEQLAGLLDEIKQATVKLEVETLKKETLWDRWGTFLLLIVLLTVEWYLRKKWGLV